MTEGEGDSPCIKVCKLDPATQVCIGCYRTIDEIAGWISYSDEQRAAVCSALKARHAGGRKRCGHCNAEFTCAAETPGVQCWCASFPRVTPPIGSNELCLCPKCLMDAIERAQGA